MKKILSILFSVALIFSLASCEYINLIGGLSGANIVKTSNLVKTYEAVDFLTDKSSIDEISVKIKYESSEENADETGKETRAISYSGQAYFSDLNEIAYGSGTFKYELSGKMKTVSEEAKLGGNEKTTTTVTEKYAFRKSTSDSRATLNRTTETKGSNEKGKDIVNKSGLASEGTLPSSALCGPSTLYSCAYDFASFIGRSAEGTESKLSGYTAYISGSKIALVDSSSKTRHTITFTFNGNKLRSITEVYEQAFEKSTLTVTVADNVSINV